MHNSDVLSFLGEAVFSRWFGCDECPGGGPGGHKVPSSSEDYLLWLKLYPLHVFNFTFRHLESRTIELNH